MTCHCHWALVRWKMIVEHWEAAGMEGVSPKVYLLTTICHSFGNQAVRTGRRLFSGKAVNQNSRAWNWPQMGTWQNWGLTGMKRVPPQNYNIRGLGTIQWGKSFKQYSSWEPRTGAESAVEKPSYTHLSGNPTLRAIIERWARHKYTTCNGSYPLSKDHHPIYTKGLLYFCGTRHKCGNCDTILYFRESRHARVQKEYVHNHHLQAL